MVVVFFSILCMSFYLKKYDMVHRLLSRCRTSTWEWSWFCEIPPPVAQVNLRGSSEVAELGWAKDIRPLDWSIGTTRKHDVLVV